MEITKSVNILKYQMNQLSEETDVVIKELPLTIYINNKEYATLLCTPKNFKALVVGYLHSEFLINELNDIQNLIIDEEKGLAYVALNGDMDYLDDVKIRYITSGCASSAVYYNTLDALKLKKTLTPFNISLEIILEHMHVLNNSSQLFKETGGVHLAALCSREQILIKFEDIGRHNAVDKIVGEMLINNISPQGKMMMISGRISSEMVLKCAKKGITILISRSAPMDKAIQIAETLNMVLIGFARGQKANVYTGFSYIEV